MQQNKKRRKPRVKSVTLKYPSSSLFAAELKKAKAEGKKCHAKTMGSKKTDRDYIQRTPHVPLRQNTEEKKRGKELRVV